MFDRDKTFHFTVESLENHLAKKTSFKFALATIYNTVHAFKKAGHLSEVDVRGKKLILIQILLITIIFMIAKLQN